MNIITTTGYYGTGSSAITDLMMEFNDIHCVGDIEIRYFHDPFGLSDIEYYLVENPNRHNSGYALKKFEKNVKYWSGNRFIKRYERLFEGNFLKESQSYIEKLKLSEFKGYWHMDVIELPVLLRIGLRSINKIKMIFSRSLETGIYELPFSKTYLVDETVQSFLMKTVEYNTRLFKSIITSKSTIMVDQLVPPSNIKRYLRYLPELKVFLVDRDPRDLYILEKFIWRGGIIPTDNVEVFCQWFEVTRKHRADNSMLENVQFIQFEDLIYNYNDATQSIFAFAGLNTNNYEKFKHFDPEKSKRNTRLWLNYPEVMMDISFIEERLSDFLYDYSFMELSKT